MATPRTARYARPVMMRHTIGVSAGICNPRDGLAKSGGQHGEQIPQANPSVQVTSSTGMIVQDPEPGGRRSYHVDSSTRAT